MGFSLVLYDPQRFPAKRLPVRAAALRNFKQDFKRPDCFPDTQVT
jgi:hypothetical protein